MPGDDFDVSISCRLKLFLSIGRFFFTGRKISPRLSALPAGSIKHQPTKNMIAKPTTIEEIRKAAQARLEDVAVISVNIETSFGIVTVFKNGEIRMA